MAIVWCVCPDCGLPAEIRFTVCILDAEGHIHEGYATICAGGHFLTTAAHLVTLDERT